jgi:hypothetical protein
MTNAEVGMRVDANLGGLTVGGVPCVGMITPATIIAIDPDAQAVTVHLDTAVGGVGTVRLEEWRISPSSSSPGVAAGWPMP